MLVTLHHLEYVHEIIWLLWICTNTQKSCVSYNNTLTQYIFCMQLCVTIKLPICICYGVGMVERKEDIKQTI